MIRGPFSDPGLASSEGGPDPSEDASGRRRARRGGRVPRGRHLPSPAPARTRPERDRADGVGRADGLGSAEGRPGRSRRGWRGRRLPVPGPGTRRFLVLACGPDDVPAVDLASGAMARLRVAWNEDRVPDLSPFDVVDAVIADDPERDDLAQPEAVSVTGTPVVVGTLPGRRSRRLLRHLVAPFDRHLLGFPGTSWPYWEFHGTRPSVALVTPTRGPLVFRRRTDDSVWARFGGPQSDNWLPVEDRRVVAALWATRRDRLSGKDLASALGFRPHYVLVTVTRPRDGYCVKVVSALLPRP